MEILVSSICISIHLGEVTLTEKKLLEDLKKNHHRKIRPVLNNTTPVNVYFDIEITQIIAVVSKFSKLALRGFLEAIYRVLEALRSLHRNMGFL